MMNVQEAKAAMPDFDISQVVIGGTNIGLIAQKGHEIHVQLDKTQALIHARKIIRNHIAPRLEKLGYLTTISTGDEKTERFLKRLGFNVTAKVGSISVHRLDALQIQ
jgi:phenylalanyl-tRNA synthetase beta subunit